jgi:hypothetical protein
LNAAKQEVIICDYVDFEVPLLAKMYTRRQAGYKAIGYEVVLPENKSRAAQLLLEVTAHEAGNGGADRAG